MANWQRYKSYVIRSFWTGISKLINILEKKIIHLIVHVGTNDAIKSSHQKIVDNMLKLKSFITDKLNSFLVTILMPVKQTDKAKAFATMKRVHELSELKN